MTADSPVIMFVDDEPNILAALRRLFIDEDMEVLTAENGESALELLSGAQVAVIVSDNLMPKMTGIEFLQRARLVSPDSIRVLMTGYVDIQSAIDAINKGEVYRFITKPWNDDVFRQTVRDAAERYKVVTAMRSAGEATLLSLAQTIELKDPYTRGHCDRVARYAVITAGRLGFSEEDLIHIRHGSWLHDCGKIGVPEAILNHAGPLTPGQMDIVRNHSRWGAEVARLARLPETVVNIILCHHEKFDGSGYPQGLRGRDIPYHARIVTVADYYDALSTDRPYRKALTRKDALAVLSGCGGTDVDPNVLEVFLRVVSDEGAVAFQEKAG